MSFWSSSPTSPFQMDEPRVRGRWINGQPPLVRPDPSYSEWEIERAGSQDRHPYDETNFLLEGELFVESGGRTVRLQPGDMVRVSAGHTGRYWAPVYARMFGIDGPNPTGAASSDFDYWEIEGEE